jgi:hypothetical protein
MTDDRTIMERANALAERRFHTLEELTEFFNIQLSRANLEPAPLVRKHQAIAVAIARDLALAAFRQEQERAEAELDAKLTPGPPPRPALEPLLADATDEERAERLYGPRPERAPLRVRESREAVDHEADDQAAGELYGEPLGLGRGVTNPNTHRDDYPPTPGEPV